MDNTVYITVRNAKLSKDGNMLVVNSNSGDILKRISLNKIRDIVCFASVALSSAIRNSLFKREIDLVFITEKGKMIGRLDGFNTKLADIRMAQYSMTSSQKLVIAKSIVKGKIENSRTMILRWKNRTEILEIKNILNHSISSCRAAIDMIDSADNTDELMGIEGFASSTYFKAMSLSIKQPLGFSERNRRPPKDPINALLSFAYTILYSKVLTAVNRAGLDPALSCLHSVVPRRMSLALDLMEEFRSIICDTSVLKIVNSYSVGKEDFFKNAFDGGVKMSSLAISRLVDSIETRLSDRIIYARLSRKLDYRSILQWQAWHYRDCILTPEMSYIPIKIR